MFTSYRTPSERNIKFNAYDDTMQIDRRSMNGEKYDVIDGLPLNPQGRTGMCGRGKLGRWGPNHAGDPIVTRSVTSFINTSCSVVLK